jgi:hypothetical protein
MNCRLYILTIITVLLVHSVVSFCCYKCLAPLTKERFVVSKSDVTTPEEKARGEMNIAILNKEVVTRVVPVPLIIYIWAGYASVAASIVFAIYKSLVR